MQVLRAVAVGVVAVVVTLAYVHGFRLGFVAVLDEEVLP